MKDRNKNIDEDTGISILNTRLSGERLDDDVINELMISTKEEKKSRKKSTIDSKNINSENPANEKINLSNAENMSQNDNVMNEPGTVQKVSCTETGNAVADETKAKGHNLSSPSGEPNNYVQPNVYADTNSVNYNQAVNYVTAIPRVSPVTQYVSPTVQQVSPEIKPNVYSQMTQQTVLQQPVYSNQPYTENAAYQIMQSQPSVQKTRKRISTKGRKSTVRKIFDAIIYKVIGIAIITAVIFLLTKYVFGFVKLDNEYMLPTYDKGETLITEKISVYFGSYALNDIVIVKKSGKVFAARVIGCPGDTINIDKEGSIYINGEMYEETERFDNILEAGMASEEIKLGSKEFFVLSDNRNDGFDSRNVSVGVIKKREICGSVLFNFNFNN